MPIRNTSNSDSYNQILCNIQVNKFEITHVVLLLGDINASLERSPNNRHDVKLKQFYERNNQQSRHEDNPTFLHVITKTCLFKYTENFTTKK